MYLSGTLYILIFYLLLCKANYASMVSQIKLLARARESHISALSLRRGDSSPMV